MKHAVFLAVGVVVVVGARASADEAPNREIPEPFARFEHMVGSWKGTAVPAANRLKGWPETHLWAWKFAKGIPIGMTIEWKGDKTLTRALLTYAADARQYRLEGTGPAGESLTFTGAFDKAGKALVLDRVGGSGGGKERITIRPNSNLIRYVMDFDHQEPGAPQYKRVVEVGLTKEGESFAAGGSSADLPRCILTGGAATMTVSYQGKSYPICCSGCRDEFNENPEKYAKKAALMGAQSAKTAAKPAGAKVGKDDGAFDGLVDDEKPRAKTAAAKPARKGAAAKTETAGDDDSDPKADAKTAARAGVQLQMGQNLEKSGKSAAALQYYKKVVKDFPKTPQAKTAAARIKALEGK